MTAANPRLVYCSLPGFASDDPRASQPGWEGSVAAATGTYKPNARTGRPIYTAIPISSTYAAFQAAVSVAMALIARERDGAGQVIEVPLFDATFGAIGYQGLKVHRGGGAIDAAAMARMMGWTRQFECQDGRWFMYHAGNLNAPRFFDAVGAAAWRDATNENQSPEELRQKSEALFLTKTAEEWEKFCEEIGTEGSICRTSSEWLANPHALGSAIVTDIDDPVLGKVRGPGINVRMSATPGAIRHARHAVDADRASILAEAAAQHPAPSAGPGPDALRAVLDGVKVIDLCIILAGPTSARTLAEFGADVIKIDSPHRAQVAFHNDINRAKRSILLDLKTPEGLDVFWRLVEDADVVVQNFRKGVADRLGIGYEAVRARKPDIIYGSMNTYGQVGPFAGRPGHEQIAQAATGMQERFGGDARPVLQPFAVNDYGTGYMGAFGVALALLHRNRTGQGQHIDTSLAYTATMLQSSLIQDYAGKTWDEPRGQEAIGSGPLHRAYEASDGWLFVTGTRAQLGGVAALAGIAAAEGVSLEAALEASFKNRTVAEWTAALLAAGMGAHRILPDATSLMSDPWVEAHGLSVTRDHEGFGPITTTGPAPRLSRTPVVPGRPAPKPGSDAASILAEAGLLDRMHALVEAGVVVMEGVGAR
jgi:crotonobetainyl-CoA:carnitine CoA-transferase CaiB-like acyl-CoA transferase